MAASLGLQRQPRIDADTLDGCRKGSDALMPKLHIAASHGVACIDRTAAPFKTLTDMANVPVSGFAPGAQIATPRGERAVETLAVGDRVVTRDHGLQRIRWIGHHRMRGIGDLAPILIKPGVVTGQDRDLLVSPQHRLLFQGHRAELLFGQSEVLIKAKHLVDGTQVIQQDMDSVTYIHLLFDHHEIVFANGGATESFHPDMKGIAGVDSAAREALFAVFPELRADIARYGTTARMCLRKDEAEMVRM